MAAKDQVIEHFDELSASGAWSHLYQVFDPNTYHFHVRRKRVLELLPDRLGDVLDVGCGPGIMGDSVLERGGTFCGLDASPEMLSEARRRLSGRSDVRLVQGDIEALPFQDGAFDQVLCMAVLEYLSATQRALAEIARVTKPGGVTVITMPKRLHIDRITLAATAPGRALVRAVSGRAKSDPPKLLLQPSELDKAASSAGLKPDGKSLYQFTPVPYPITRLIPKTALRANLGFERYHSRTTKPVAFLAHGFVARYVKPSPA